MRLDDFPPDTPHLKEILQSAPNILANGGSCIAGPDSEWIVAPVIENEGLIISTIDFNRVLEERQNFDVAGHYSRTDITKLTVNRAKQSIVDIVDDNEKS
jgi:nitrilase